MASSVRSSSADPLARVDAALARAFVPGAGKGAPGAAGDSSRAICVGLSGGCDSVVLLHALVRLARTVPIRVTAVHVHHGLSPNADHWAAFCRRLCRREKVSLKVVQVQVDRADGLGIEAAARAARHQVFASLKVDTIALAHHQDDQAETVLLQLLRGAGLRGLSAMPLLADSPAPSARAVISRPLLRLPRAVLEAYARQMALEWIDDESNADTAFDRNFIRHRVLPLLEARFPAARATLARSSQLLADAASLVEAVALEDLARARAGAPDSLSLPVLGQLGDARAREVLRAWLRQHGVPMPAERRLAEALRQSFSAQANRAVAVRVDPLTLRRYRDRLYLTGLRQDEHLPGLGLDEGIDAARKSETTADGSRTIHWNRRARMRLTMLGGTLVAEPVVGAGVSQRLLDAGLLEVGARASLGPASLRMRIGDPPRHRTLKNLWQESAVPPWQRERWPLLWLDGELACIPGVAIVAGLCAEPGAPGRVFHWLPD